MGIAYPGSNELALDCGKPQVCFFGTGTKVLPENKPRAVDTKSNREA